MFRVYPVEGGYQIFWCPSAPMHYSDKIPHDDKIYTKRQAAYRRKKQLDEELARRKAEERKDAA
jgi:hypothetical protein